MKKFIGKKLTKKVKFMDGEVEVRVLTVGDIRSIENKSKLKGKYTLKTTIVNSKGIEVATTKSSFNSEDTSHQIENQLIDIDSPRTEFGQHFSQWGGLMFAFIGGSSMALIGWDGLEARWTNCIRSPVPWHL